MSNYVYHASKTQNIKELIPFKSTHGEKWVYGTNCLEMSIVFLSPFMGDLSCQIFRDENSSKVTIVERYQGAFKDRYKGISGSIYVLNGESFQKGKTQWNEEVVSEKPVVVIEEIKISDAEKYIKGLEKEDKIHVYYYPDKPKHIPQDDSDLFYKYLNSIITSNRRNEIFINEKHPALYVKIVNELIENPIETFISFIQYNYKNDVDLVLSLTKSGNKIEIRELIENGLDLLLDYSIKEILVPKQCVIFNIDDYIAYDSEKSMFNRLLINNFSDYLDKLKHKKKLKVITFKEISSEFRINYLFEYLKTIKKLYVENEGIYEAHKPLIHKYHKDIYEEVIRYEKEL
ncbi:MAG: hypothetical protein JXR48_08690 [Candidatus Delongbacteria bacterium]|nr:hypothetical protein [Candidatus Delongbacteria bacterium]MBN2835029.1 hypothetical protein [Candidatus Delongbacteria bacterium]